MKKIVRLLKEFLADFGIIKREILECDDDIRDMARRARGWAKDSIESRGLKLGEPKFCKVVRLPGEIKQAGIWYFRSEMHGYDVGGYSRKRVVVVACDPVTKAVHPAVLEHEFAHHWLLNYHDIRNHDPRFRNAFIFWRD